MGVLESYDLKNILIIELFEERIYNRHYEINEGDIVVDIGASVGIFPFSIADKKPKHVYCLEPSAAEFPTLVKNTRGLNVTPINKAIMGGDSVTNELTPVYYNELGGGYYETMKFSTFLKLYAIDHINFLKTDSEGGEYHIFTPENINFIKDHVDVIVGEWHLENPVQKQMFKHFRDTYLPMFKEYFVYSIDGVDIKWDLWNDHFIEYYDQVIIHINNRK